MMRNNIISLFISLLCVLTNMVQAQEVTFFKKFNNSTLDFGIYRTSMYQTGSDEILKPDVYVKVNLADDIRDMYKRLTYQQILLALSDSKTDWATNLLLYELYKKSAVKFLVIKTREDWIKASKAEDIEYWTKVILKGN